MEIFFKKTVIIGVGLIGGSLALALKKRRLTEEVVGVGHRAPSLKRAQQLGVIDRFSLKISPLVKEADLVVLATPVNLIASYLIEIIPTLKKKCLAIDVGSTKNKIVKGVEKKFPFFSSFVPCHPIAGSEKAKVDFAREDLFEKAVCVITPGENTSPSAVKKAKALWQILGAKIVLCPPSLHDRLLSFSSHLPHLLAFGLVETLLDETTNRPLLIQLIGKGFLDTTRIAASDPFLWEEVFFSNRVELKRALKKLRKKLDSLERLIDNKDSQKLLNILEKISQFRKQLGERTN